MNVGLILLWILVVIVLVFLIFVSLRAMQQYHTVRSATPVNIEARCTVPFDSVPSVAGLNCCLSGETLTASRYVPSLNMVVNPIATPYFEVCQGFCPQGTDAEGTQCVGGVGQADFERCLQLTAPRNECRGVAMPVAALGTTFYYAQSAGSAACRNSTVCR